MSEKPNTPQTIDDYIAGYPEDIQALLEKIRRVISDTAPEAEEAIKYGLPTFTLQGNLLSFAAYKTHIGLYPAPAGTEAFNKKLAAYKTAKATVRFPLDQPIPFDLVREIVKYRVKEILGQTAAKGEKKQAKAGG